LNFFHNVFKTLGFVCSFLTFNVLFCLIVLLLGLLCNIQSILLLGFVLLGCMGLLLVVPQFMLVESLYLLLFSIVFEWLGRTVFLGIWILYILQIYTWPFRKSTNGIVIHYIGWGFQSPNLQEIHCFKWEFCVQFALYFSGT
jgi:hypothetical protein